MIHVSFIIQGGSNMSGTNCDLFRHKSSRSYLNHLVLPTAHACSHYMSIVCDYIFFKPGVNFRDCFSQSFISTLLSVMYLLLLKFSEHYYVLCILYC